MNRKTIFLENEVLGNTKPVNTKPVNTEPINTKYSNKILINNILSISQSSASVDDKIKQANSKRYYHMLTKI